MAYLTSRRLPSMVLELLITKYSIDSNQKAVYEFEEIVKLIEGGELGESESNATRKVEVSKSTLVLPPNYANLLEIPRTYQSVFPPNFSIHE